MNSNRDEYEKDNNRKKYQCNKNENNPTIKFAFFNQSMSMNSLIENYKKKKKKVGTAFNLSIPSCALITDCEVCANVMYN